MSAQLSIDNLRIAKKLGLIVALFAFTSAAAIGFATTQMKGIDDA